MTLIPSKTITFVLKVLTYIITSITARPIELAAILTIMSVAVILVIMYVKTFKTNVIVFDGINVIM
jgi:hypothetical protein